MYNDYFNLFEEGLLKLIIILIILILLATQT